MKKIYLLFIGLCMALSSQAISIHSSAGNLEALIRSAGVGTDTLTELTVSGTIDARDLVVLRDTLHSLLVADLSQATIALYTGSYGTRLGAYQTYAANTFPELSSYSTQLLKKLLLPLNLVAIDGGAFSGLQYVDSLYIPASVSRIDILSFNKAYIEVDEANLYYSSLNGVLYNKNQTILQECPTSISDHTIASTVLQIADGAFRQCIATITVDAANPNYASQDGVLFNKDKSLLIQCPISKTGTYTIPSTVKEINDHAFYYCKILNKVVIPNSVEIIENYGFYRCYSFETVTIPTSISVLGRYSFGYCLRLKEVNFNAINCISMTESNLSSNAFCYCDSLTTLNIGDSVTTFPFYAFKGSKLTAVIMPNSLTSLGMSCFYQCYKIKEIKISSKIKKVSNRAFYSCKETEKLYIPNSVNRIDTLAFYNLLALKEVRIPSSVDTIDDRAFKSCSTLVSIFSNRIAPVDLSASPEVFAGVDTLACVLYVPIGSEPAYQAANQWKSFQNITEVDTLKSLHLSAGSLQNALSHVETQMITHLKLTGTINAQDIYYLRDSLPSLAQLDLHEISIEGYTGVFDTSLFRSATVIKTFPANCLPLTAFKDKITLRSISLPASLTDIQDQAFSGCIALDSITLYNPTPIDLSATTEVFKEVDKSSCVLTVPSGSVPSYRVATIWQDFLDIAENTTTSSAIPSASSVKVIVQDGHAIISGLTIGETLSLYTIQAAPIYKQQVQADCVSVPLPAHGVYVLQLGTECRKLLY